MCQRFNTLLPINSPIHDHHRGPVVLRRRPRRSTPQMKYLNRRAVERENGMPKTEPDHNSEQYRARMSATTSMPEPRYLGPSIVASYKTCEVGVSRRKCGELGQGLKYWLGAGWRIYNVVGSVKDFLNTPHPRRAERLDCVPGARFVTAESPWCFFITRSLLNGRCCSCHA
jgi:hypothetical protein